ncbi:energy-coupling factor transporter transmembrane component T family protein [[Eubacterium] cellulosolvens]
MNGENQNSNTSPFHRLNPVSNLVILICIIILILFFTHPLFSFVILLIVLLMYVVAGIKAALIIKKARFLIYFSIIIFLIQVLFQSQGTVLFTLIPTSSPILPGAIPITTTGIYLGISMMLRFLGIVLASLFFVAVTNPNKLAYSLMRLGLPYRYGFMLVTSLRFLPVFEVEADTVRKAQKSRGINLEGRGIKGLYQHIKYTLRPLIVTALQKAETLSRSMEGRGFGVYKDRVFIDKSQMTVRDKIITYCMIVLTIIIILSFSLYYNQNEIDQLIFSNWL